METKVGEMLFSSYKVRCQELLLEALMEIEIRM